MRYIIVFKINEVMMLFRKILIAGERDLCRLIHYIFQLSKGNGASIARSSNHS
jgi:hypothetical protein